MVSAIAIVVFVIVSRTSIVEDVKKSSARLFEYEYIPNQNIDIDNCIAASAYDSVYKDFRKKYRFHYQTIGKASFDDSSHIILLSDIPPHFEIDSIASIFAQFTYKQEIRKHRIGYDGFVTDIIILLGNATQKNCDRLLSRLDKNLFFSEYKPAVMVLPAKQKRQYFSNENIDYQISLDEFNSWFIEDGEEFVRLEDTAKVMTVSDLFALQSRGVFFSKQPGFLAWAIAKNCDINSQITDIRQFSLDADIILGALADSNTLVIIGRERQSPLYVLPPLQTESILLLASTTEKELSQSLDINDLMAGKMVDGRDWCPTYLSKELENTEFGDLMTMTDVLLKDWSEQGTIKESYYRYPEPSHYPFDRPLFRKLGLNELVYNWNTAGAMYAIDRDGYTIYTLNRTGALPVSYFNSQERSESIGYRYENQAYNYFATIGNTDLARVVQYTALYQLFIDNNISYSGNTYPSFPKNKPFLLYKPTADLLNRLRNLDASEIDILTDSLSQRSFRRYQKEHIDKQLHENEQNYHFSYTDEDINNIYRNIHQNIKKDFAHSINEVKNLLNGLSEEQFVKLVRYLSYPRGVKIYDRESYNTYLHGKRVNRLMREIGKNNLDLIGMDLNNVKNYFASNLSENSGRYMKTSSLIITFNDMLTTGGHNLSSHINRVNSMTNYKRSRGAKSQSPPMTEPSMSNHDTSAHKRSGSTPTQTAQKKNSNNISTTKQSSSIRSRNAVIPTYPRSKRGL